MKIYIENNFHRVILISDILVFTDGKLIILLIDFMHDLNNKEIYAMKVTLYIFMKPGITCSPLHELI